MKVIGIDECVLLDKAPACDWAKIEKMARIDVAAMGFAKGANGITIELARALVELHEYQQRDYQARLRQQPCSAG
jgi:hypothetical protein